MDTQEIKDRIQILMIERSNLEQSHAGLVRDNQRMNQEFQQQVAQNQTRFAQISGAVTELTKLVQQPTQKEPNNDNLPTSPNRHHWPVDVCPVEQSQDR